jgi:VanZ family protein
MKVRVPLLPRWVRWSTVLVVAAAIVYLSILTAPPEDPVVPQPDLIPLDKWRHFLAYAAFGGSLAYATADWQWRRWTLVAVVLGTAVLFGVGIEVWQSFIPQRYFSLGDAYANALGGLLVLPWFLIRPHLTLTPVGSWIRSVVGAT